MAVASRIAWALLLAAGCLAPWGPGVWAGLPNTIAVVEPIPGNVAAGHRALAGLEIKLSHPESAQPNPDFHATAVASRIFPDNGLSDTPIDGGYASRDRWKLWSYQVQTTTHFPAALEQLGAGARIINHSAGYFGGTSGNELRTRLFDRMIYRHRNLVTQIAHNEGPANGTLLEPAGSYNAVVIGASGPAEAPPDADPFRGLAEGSYIADYSSRGPTDDGRRKPDLIAPGTFLRLATYDPADDGATKLTAGTSFAGPYVAGVAARLIEQADDLGWNSDPLVLKAVLLNSAQEVSRKYNHLTGVSTPETWDGWSPTNTTRPLDVDQGAGEVSLPRAQWQYFTNPRQHGDATVAHVGWDYDEALAPSQARWYFFERPVAAGARLTATLNWFREFNQAGDPLPLDDLNLELWSTDGLEPVSLVTQSNSAIDNVEHLHRYELPAAGFYALAVRFAASPSGGGADPFGLAWMLPDSPFLPGDADLDGRVGLVDFVALRAGFGLGRTWAEGDFDLNRQVDLADFALLKLNFGRTGAAGAAAVPEPAGLWMAGLALAWAMIAALARRPLRSTA